MLFKPLDHAFNLRLSTELVGRVDRIKDQMNKTHGLALTRSMVIRALIEKGAEQYELTKVEVAEPVLEEKTVVEGQA
jgi:predicted DNA-binding protein